MTKDWRSLARLAARSLDTCIWLTPTSAAISDWVIPSTNRRRTISRSRSGKVSRAYVVKDKVITATKGAKSAVESAGGRFEA